MSGRLDLVNAGKGIRTCVVWEDGIPLICKTQEVAGLLEANARLRAAYDHGATRRNAGGFQHVARIPAVVWAQLQAAGIVDGMTVIDERRYLQFLSDGDARNLRVDDGRRLA